MIEIFSDRIEISNPGLPLIDVRRFVGAAPRSRNELLSALMRRMKICEERGSGITKVVTSIELYQLPPIDFRADGHTTKITLHAPRKFKDMNGQERMRACFQHASLKYISGEMMTNTSFRDRLGVEKRNAAQVSRIITDTLAQEWIRPGDPSAPRSGYVPYWA
jgi:predicted HTH transcriptional regulator